MTSATPRSLHTALAKPRLLSIAQKNGLPVTLRWHKAALVDLLAYSAEVRGAEEVLSRWTREDLRLVCRLNRLPSYGAKESLVNRLLETLDREVMEVNAGVSLRDPVGEPITRMSLLSAHKKARGEPLDFRFRSAVGFAGKADRATHYLHPYPGKLLHHVAGAMVQLFSSAGDLVLDPFCGSGTVALEAALAGRRSVVVDQNPFACLLTRAKTNPVPSSLVRSMADEVLRRARSGSGVGREPTFWNLERWYPPAYLFELRRLRGAIEGMRKVIAPEVLDLLDVIFLNTARGISYADPSYSVPVRIAKSRRLSASGQRHLRQLECADPLSRFREQSELAARRMESYRNLLEGRSPAVAVLHGDARNAERWPGLARADLIVTSPPYPGSQKYIRASFPALEWLDLVTGPAGLRSLQAGSVGRERYHNSSGTPRGNAARRAIELVQGRSETRALLLRTYVCELEECIGHMAANLKTGGHLAVIVSPNTIAGTPIPLHVFVQDAMQNSGIRLQLHLRDELSTAAQPSKRHQSAGRRIESEHVVVGRK